MASAIDIGVAACLAQPEIAALVSDRVFPNVAPQGSDFPNVVVYQSGESDDLILSGPSADFPEARLSFVCRALTATSMLDLGDNLKDTLKTILRQRFVGREASFIKTATDVTGFADDPPVHERTIDFHVRWR